MKKTNIFLLIFMFIFIGCTDVLDKYPLDRPSQETFYNSAIEIERGVNACYTQLRDSETDMYNFPMSLDLMTDIGFPRQESNFKTIARGEHSSRTDLVYTVWKRAYVGIGRCNTMLQVVKEKAHLLTNDQIRQFEGELLFLRAFYHARLVNYYGDVPLVLTPITTLAEAKKLTRTNREEVINQIMLDYTEAARLLSEEYSDPKDKGRITRGAVNALKARAALYFGMYDIAESSAFEVIKSNKYKLYPKYKDLFLNKGLRDPANKELILVEDFSAEIPKYTELVLYNATRNTGGWSATVPSQNLIDSYHCLDGKDISKSSSFNKKKPFENRDPRLKFSFVLPGDKFGDYRFEGHADSVTCLQYSTNKYVRNNDSYSINQFTSYTGYNVRKFNDEEYISKNTKCDYPIILCRYAEVLLTYAEAKIEQNKIDQSVVDAINSVRRDRDDVKMPIFMLTDFNNQDKARLIVRHERKIELAFEGFRYFDLRRWGWADKYSNIPILGRPFKGAFDEWPSVTFDENGEPVYDVNSYEPHPSKDYRIVENRLFIPGKHELWPIPQTEIDMNANLKQNPKY